MGYVASHGGGGHDKPCAKCAASAKYAREIDALRTERDAAREVAKAPCGRCLVLDAKVEHLTAAVHLAQKYLSEMGHGEESAAAAGNPFGKLERTLRRLEGTLLEMERGRDGSSYVWTLGAAHSRGDSGGGPTPSPASNDGGVSVQEGSSEDRPPAGRNIALGRSDVEFALFAALDEKMTHLKGAVHLTQRSLVEMRKCLAAERPGARRAGGLASQQAEAERQSALAQRTLGQIEAAMLGMERGNGGGSSRGVGAWTSGPGEGDSGGGAIPPPEPNGSFREVERHLGADQSPSGTGLGDREGTNNGGSGAPTKPPAPSDTPVGPAVGDFTAAPASSEGAVQAPAGEGTAPKLFGGRTPRNVLISFYATHNQKFMREPLNVNAVDELLSKYAGREEALFRKLAEKYRVDPAVFGLEAVGKDGGETPSPTAVAMPEPPKAAAPTLQIPNGPDVDGNGGETPSPTAISRAEPPKPAAPALQIPTLAQLGIKDGRLPAGPPPTLQPTAAKPSPPATEAAPTLDSVLAACTPYLTGSSRHYAAWLRDEMDVETPSDLAEAVETCLDDIAEGDGSVGINPMCLYLFEKAVRDAAKEGEGRSPEALEGKGAMGNGASPPDNPILWPEAAPMQNAVAEKESGGEAKSPSSVAPTLDSVLASCASYLTGSPLQYAAWLREEMDIETPSDLAEAVEDCFEEIAEGDGTVGVKLACSYLFQHRVKALV